MYTRARPHYRLAFLFSLGDGWMDGRASLFAFHESFSFLRKVFDITAVIIPDLAMDGFSVFFCELFMGLL